MRYFLAVLLAGALAASVACAAGAEGILVLKNGQIYAESGGKSTALAKDMFAVLPVENSNMLFCGIGEDDAQENGVKAGLYIFENDGAAIAFAPTEAAEYCSTVELSPDGKVLAVDAGTWLIRSWVLFSFPDMEFIEELSYLSSDSGQSLIWVEDSFVIFPSMDVENSGRVCDYDPCGPVSVDYYAFADGKTRTLLKGTDLCDYTLQGYDSANSIVEADKLCLDSAKDWERFPENIPMTKISVEFPR